MPRTLSEQEFEAVKQKVLGGLPTGLSEDEFHRVVGPAMEQALGEAENTAAPVEGSAAGRFLSNAGEMLNPVSMAKGLYQAATHPIDTVTNIGGQMAAEAGKSRDMVSQGRYTEAIGHAGAAAIPVLGPMAAQAGEQIASGDIAGGLGKAAGLIAPAATPAVVRGAKSALRAAPEAVATGLDAGAQARVVDVMAPKVGANKARFGGMAEKVAPELLKRDEAGAWTREGLHQTVQANLVSAEQALDTAADSRLNARTFPTQPIIADLMAKRARLTAEAVEGSRPVPTYQGDAVRGAHVTNDPATTELTAGPNVTTGDLARHDRGYRTMTGTFADEPARTGRPIGQDVEPSPNAARIAAIDQAISEVKQLGPVARYEPLRRIREAWDGPAKVKYNPSMTADFLKNQGYATGAADVTGTLRESLAKFDPETAKANAQYALYRAADDVLSATAEVQRTRPTVGRQIMARLTGAVVGGQAAGATGAVGGFVLGPVLDSVMNAGGTSKLQTAQLMSKLAAGIRRGDMGYVNSLSVQLKRLSRNALRQVGNATSPSESQSQTTAPLPSTP